MKASDAYVTARGWADGLAEELVENHRGRARDVEAPESCLHGLAPLVVDSAVVHSVQRLCDFFELFPHPDDASAVLSVQELLIELLRDGIEIVGNMTQRRPVNQDTLRRFLAAADVAERIAPSDG